MNPNQQRQQNPFQFIFEQVNQQQSRQLKDLGDLLKCSDGTYRTPQEARKFDAEAKKTLDEKPDTR